jgi:hypothetical protein
MERRDAGLSIVAAGAGVDGKAGTEDFAFLIVIVKRGFAIPTTLAEFTRHASSNPAHLHDVHFTAARANALHLRFAEPFNLGNLVKLWVSIL